MNQETTTALKIELKNVKHSDFASEETNCFEATIYVDGKRAGTARNEGQGGSTWVEPAELRERLNAYGQTLPKVVTDMTVGKAGEKFEYQPDAESIIDDLLTEYLIRRDLKRDLAKRILYVDAAGTVKMTKTFPAATLQGFLAKPDAVKAKLNATQILNLLPFEEALKITKAAG